MNSEKGFKLLEKHLRLSMLNVISAETVFDRFTNDFELIEDFGGPKQSLLALRENIRALINQVKTIYSKLCLKSSFSCEEGSRFIGFKDILSELEVAREEKAQDYCNSSDKKEKISIKRDLIGIDIEIKLIKEKILGFILK